MARVARRYPVLTGYTGRSDTVPAWPSPTAWSCDSSSTHGRRSASRALRRFVYTRTPPAHALCVT